MDDLLYKRFQPEDYADYASWFRDPELNRRLGPMDQAWLEAVLAEPEWQGVTWAVFRAAELVAVIETVFDRDWPTVAWISAVATKPNHRGQGIASAVMKWMLSLHHARGIVQHVAVISVDNTAGRRCAEQAGFRAISAEPDAHGYLKFEHNME